jgi:hypothetical protein
MQVRQQNSAVVSIATLLARHDRFGDGAGKVGLVTVSSRQFYDTSSRSRLPYE